jgi:hypothetical protein
VYLYRAPTQQKIHVQRGKDELKIIFQSGEASGFLTSKNQKTPPDLGLE